MLETASNSALVTTQAALTANHVHYINTTPGNIATQDPWILTFEGIAKNTEKLG